MSFEGQLYRKGFCANPHYNKLQRSADSIDSAWAPLVRGSTLQTEWVFVYTVLHSMYFLLNYCLQYMF